MFLYVFQKVERRVCTTTFSVSVGCGWMEWFLPSSAGEASGKETPNFVSGLAFHVSVCRTGTGTGCFVSS